MSRYRKIHCLIWLDDKFPFLKPEEQATWFHAYTYPHSTAMGIYTASIEALAGNMRVPVETYRKRFGNLSDSGFVTYSERFQTVWFPKFFKWNVPENPNVLKGWIKVLEEIPDSDIKANCISTLREYAETWGDKYLNVTPNVPETFGVTFPKQEQEQEQEQEQDNKTNVDLSLIKGNGKDKPENQVFDYWRDSAKKPTAKFIQKRKRAVMSRLKEGYSVADLFSAIDGCLSSPYHQGKNEQQAVYDDLELICRDGTKVEKFIAISKNHQAGGEDLQAWLSEDKPVIEGEFTNG